MAVMRYSWGTKKWPAALGALACALGLGLSAAGPAAAAAVSSSPGSASAGSESPGSAAHTESGQMRAVQPAAGTYVARTPARILDTRSGLGHHGGQVGPNQTVDLKIAGQGGIPPTGAGAVVLNVTVTQPAQPGHITVYPSHVALPSVSNLNFIAHQDIANLVTVPLGPDGRVELTNASTGATQLVADVEGYFVAGTPSVAGAFKSLTPSRVLDSRINVGASRVPAFGTVAVQIAGQGGIPVAGAGAVAINITVTAPTGAGNVTVYPSTVGRPTASNLNFRAGQSVPNLVIVPIGADGKIKLYNNSVGSIQLIGDVQGYFIGSSSAVTGGFRPLTPTRFLDTRSGFGGSGRVSAGGEVKVHIDGHGGVPVTGVSAVVVNVTVTRPAWPGDVVAYPTGVVKPSASNLNFQAGQDVPNLVVVPGDEFGWISLANNSSGAADLIADVAGYFLGTGVVPNVLGPFSYGPFTMGMTSSQVHAAAPTLAITQPTSNLCGSADTPGFNLVFNRGTTKLSFIRVESAVQTANGIHVGDTVGSVLQRFPSATLSPDDPNLTLAITPPGTPEPLATSYWFSVGMFSSALPPNSDTVTHMSLDQDERCFD